MKPSSQEIDKQAAGWALKLDARPLGPDEQASLDRWLEADVRHPGALLRAVATLARVDRLGAVGLAASDCEAPRETSIFTRRRVVVAGGGAAGLAAAGGAFVLLRDNGAREEFVTKIGESCSVSLSDGSTIVLNTDSRLQVAFTERERGIRLARGEALFRVAKDKKRPFIVAAGDTQVRAVGTSFNVKRLPNRPVQILVQEGVVEVTEKSSPIVRPVRAVAGTRTVVLHDNLIAMRTVPAPQIARDLAWQYGRLEFTNETLADAAREYARYSGTKITVDPAVATLTVTGSFDSKDAIGFAKAAAGVLDLRLQMKDNEIQISR